MVTEETELEWHVKGLDCPACAQTVEKGVAQLPGVSFCELNFNTEKLRVRGDVPASTVVERVRVLGFEALPLPAPESGSPAPAAPPNFLRFLWQEADTRLALLGAVFILPGLLLEELLGFHYGWVDVASLLALAIAGFPIARSAAQAITINREININVLMTIAAVGAVFIGAYTEAAMVMVLFAVGEALEGYTSQRARHAIQSLLQVAPQTATLLRRNGLPTGAGVTPVEALRPGDVILVHPGERIPMDGRVLSGASAVNQAPITGESRPVDKVAGAEVFAGTINGLGALEVEVLCAAEDNTISRLIKMVEEAQEKRAPAQRFIDQFARYYTPAVVVLAGLVAAVPPLFFGQPFLNPNPHTFGWLYRGLALLVVSCPCALVISTPVSLISAISNGARNGVLIKGGVHLETLSRVKALAFDKTGTLTQGKPAVVAIKAVNCDATENQVHHCPDCCDLLVLAGAIEQQSEHPLAHAIVAEAANCDLRNHYPAAAMVTALAGRGITGQVGGQEITIGSHDYFDHAVPHAPVDCLLASRNAQLGYTPVLVSVEGQYRGQIAVADAVRRTSREAVLALKQLGLKPLVMLTGDNQAVAQNVGGQIGLTEVRAELLPENKVAAVKDLKAQYGLVAMVGDGINDAPALATADVGIAMGGALGGTAQAMETADITLMSDDLRRLPFAFQLSRATMRTITANVVFSLGIKLAFLIVVLLGFGTMWMAVLADVGTSLLVTLNGMRLLRRPAFREPQTN